MVFVVLSAVVSVTVVLECGMVTEGCNAVMVVVVVVVLWVV